MKKNIDTILLKEMDRKEFFSYAGALILSIFGISNLIKFFGAKESSYSGGPYGGHKEK